MPVGIGDDSVIHGVERAEPGIRMDIGDWVGHKRVRKTWLAEGPLTQAMPACLPSWQARTQDAAPSTASAPDPRLHVVVHAILAQRRDPRIVRVDDPP